MFYRPTIENLTPDAESPNVIQACLEKKISYYCDNASDHIFTSIFVVLMLIPIYISYMLLYCVYVFFKCIFFPDPGEPSKLQNKFTNLTVDDVAMVKYMSYGIGGKVIHDSFKKAPISTVAIAGPVVSKALKSEINNLTTEDRNTKLISDEFRDQILSRGKDIVDCIIDIENYIYVTNINEVLADEPTIFSERVYKGADQLIVEYFKTHTNTWYGLTLNIKIAMTAMHIKKETYIKFLFIADDYLNRRITFKEAHNCVGKILSNDGYLAFSSIKLK